ncbi:MAG TPA: nuclear transport factor 2 family protein [Nitrospiria bacterium]
MKNRAISRFLLLYALPFTLTSAFLITGVPAANEDTFITVLEKSYEASCGNVEGLRDYYLPEAEIIHDGKQTTLKQTIEDLTKTLTVMKGLACEYKPRVQGSYIGDDFAFLTLRESIFISADEVDEVEILQICTYIFLKKDDRWMITHDHCSEIDGQTV